MSRHPVWGDLWFYPFDLVWCLENLSPGARPAGCTIPWCLNTTLTDAALALWWQQYFEYTMGWASRIVVCRAYELTTENRFNRP